MQSNDSRVPKELLHCLVNGATEYALILLSPDTSIIYWNEGAKRIFGFEENEILGHSLLELFTPEDLELGVAQKELDKAARLGHADDERWHIKKDGGRFWANGVVTSARDEKGNLVGYSKVLRDQTLRKLTEDKLKSTISELTQFNYVVAHDLQEPLRVVNSYLGLVERKYKGKFDEDHDKLIATAVEGTRRMQTLLTDLLNFVCAERPGDVTLIELAAVFDTAVSNLKLQIEEAKAVVTRTSLPIVQAASPQLVQVFQNLISNAIKYRRKDVQLKLYVDVVGVNGEWQLTFADNGIGIPKEQQERVFEAFKRLHSKEEYPGSGLGLFLCKKTIERHGGRIWIESDGKTGTKVHLTLPRMADDEEK